MIPYEALNGEEPDMNHLRKNIHLSILFTHSDDRKKLQPKSQKMVFFLRYGDCVKGYCLFDEQRSKIILSRNVRFDENVSSNM